MCIRDRHYPGQALAVALYEAGGVRGCEIGTVMFGKQADGSERAAAMYLVRLAIPRRTYTQSPVSYTHLDVYKRQCILLPKATGIAPARIGARP